MNSQPTLEQFARLDEKTAIEIKHLGDKMDAWVKAFDSHVEEDRQLRRDLTDQQRQFDRLVVSLEAINRQLTDISHGFSSSVQDNTKAMAVLRADVELLKVDKVVRDKEISRKEYTVKRLIGVVGLLCSLAGVVAGHYWK